MPHVQLTDLKFGSCTVLSSSSPVIEASKLVPIQIESLSQTPSLQLRRRYQCHLWLVDYINDLLPYASLETILNTYIPATGMWSNFSYKINVTYYHVFSV